MSAQAVAGTINAPDLLAASQRVQQLQALVTAAGQGTPTASFAAALAAANSPSQAPGQPATQTSAASTAPESAALGSATGAPYGASNIAYGTAPTAAGIATATAAAPGSGLTSNNSLASASSLTSATASQTATGGASAYDSTIAQAAARYGLDPAILHGLIQQESGFDPSSRSSAGAAGLTQLMPETAAAMGVSDPLDPTQSIEGGARYLSQLMTQFGGNVTDALAAYNAGPGAVKQYGGVPPYAETQDYVTKVLEYANSYRSSQPTTANTGQIT